MSILDQMDALRAQVRRVLPPDRLAGLLAIIDQLEALAWELEDIRAALPRRRAKDMYLWN